MDYTIPLLSIVVPVYNGADRLSETIDAILATADDRIELVLVDDGSTDESPSVCDTCAASDDRVKVVHKPNGGIADARNTGIDIAKGRYLAFSDQDDTPVVSRLLSFAEALSIDDIDIGVFSTDMGTAKRTWPCDRVLGEGTWTGEDIFERFIWPMIYPPALNRDVDHLGHVWECLYSSNLVARAGIQFKKFVDIEDDYLFVFESMCAASSVQTFHGVGYIWTVNEKSVSHNPKYVDSMIEKCANSYAYMKDLLKGRKEFSAPRAALYDKVCAQFTAVRYVINAGLAPKRFFDSRRELVLYLRAVPRDSFHGPYLGKNSSRRSASVLYLLLSTRGVSIALVFSLMLAWINCHKVRLS